MMRSKLWMAALAAVVATACSQGNTPPDSGSGDSGTPADAGGSTDAGGTDAGGGDSGVDAGPVITLTGTRVIHHVVEGSSSTVDVPADLSKPGTITAFVLDAAADGGYDAYAGTGTTSGTYSIPNVPASVSNYVLQFGSFTWIQANTSTLDLGVYVVGRPNGQGPDAGTQLGLTLTGLSPWQRSLDSLVIASAGASFVDPLVAVGADAGPDAGDVAWTATVPYPPEIEIASSQGDTVSIYQLVEQDGGLMQTRYASPFFQSSTFSVVDGAINPLTAGLGGTLSAPTAIAFQAGQFDSLRSAMGPSATAVNQVVSINATAVGTGHGIVGPIATVYISTFNPVQTTAQAISASFAFPLTVTSWTTQYGTATENARVSYSVPLPDGGTVTDNETAQVTASDLTSVGVPTTPVVSPPQNVMLDGVPANAPLTLSSITPVVSWTAPAVGTPTYYRVIFTHLTVGKTGLRKTALTLLTNQTQVRLPPTMLFGGGQYYAASVQAVAMPAANFGTTPLQVALPEARADAFTALLTTP